uniref:Protein glass n=1 Tax=Panagrellus redivivus TaxID=6233 RepID=A0A7E4V157_PANRE
MAAASYPATSTTAASMTIDFDPSDAIGGNGLFYYAPHDVGSIPMAPAAQTWHTVPPGIYDDPGLFIDVGFGGQQSTWAGFSSTYGVPMTMGLENPGVVGFTVPQEAQVLDSKTGFFGEIVMEQQARPEQTTLASMPMEQIPQQRQQQQQQIPTAQSRPQPSQPMKMFGCSRCGKQYCRKSTLKAHVKHHLGERPFVCQVCGKTFSQAANLTAHRRVHTGEKPFSCSICLRPFSQSSSLVTHKRTHTGERPYPCNQCDKAFTDSSTLTKHLRTHSGQKPYSCPLCLMRFSQSGNLHRHLKTHRSEDLLRANVILDNM